MQVELRIEEPGTVFVNSLHLLRLLEGHGALVAEASERIVVVGASLADPVATPVGDLALRGGLGLLLGPLHLTVVLVCLLEGGLLLRRHGHVLGLALDVVVALDFFASVAVFAALEVIVLALGALPAAVREVEVVLLLGLVAGLGGGHGLSVGSRQERLRRDREVGRDELTQLRLNICNGSGFWYNLSVKLTRTLIRGRLHMNLSWGFVDGLVIIEHIHQFVTQN